MFEALCFKTGKAFVEAVASAGSEVGPVLNRYRCRASQSPRSSSRQREVLHEYEAHCRLLQLSRFILSTKSESHDLRFSPPVR